MSSPRLEECKQGDGPETKSTEMKNSRECNLPETEFGSGARVISWAPRISLYPAFLSEQECEHLLKITSAELNVTMPTVPDYSATFLAPLARHFDPVVKQIEERIALVTHIPPNNKEDPIKVCKYTAPGERVSPNQALFNLHHDRNEMRLGRVVTVLMYLNDPEEGGQTFFPCTSTDPADCFPENVSVLGMNASKANQKGQIPNKTSHNVDDSSLASRLGRIYEAGVSLIPSRADSSNGVNAEMESQVLGECEAACRALLEKSCNDGLHAPYMRDDAGALLVAPRKGTAVLFWSVNPYGKSDSMHAWHGAVHVQGGSTKVAAQKFKGCPILPQE